MFDWGRERRSAVVFDESHNETWTIERLLAFTNSMNNPMYYSYQHLVKAIEAYLQLSVKRNIEVPLTRKLLSDTSVLIIAHPADPEKHKGCGGSPSFSKSEIEELAA